ncbi:flagellar brake protein [Gammaproteobacteria bacterium AB-CW1]|uniref:Flagellar brake protein n=1 Tax=Natronospira elongata TaxID=3110268 RepID=A0AAP6JFC9_9GAMM|nr:flagellar brake protein [Gammaproteobacteria bacterium AB-CW1]
MSARQIGREGQLAEESGNTLKKVELTLSVGAVVNLQRANRDRSKRWNARMIGYVEGESFLITTPREGGSPAPFYLDDMLTVRYLSGTEIHGFTTWVRKVATQPLHYLHLAYPRTIEQVTIRQEERVSMDLPTRYRCLRPDEESGEGRLLDISAAGALLEADSCLGQVGEKLELDFTVAFAGSESRIQVEAEIRNLKQDSSREDGESCLHGLQFMDLEEHHRVFIKGFVYEQILQHRNNQ